MRIPVALFLSVLLFQNLSASDNERSIVLQSGSEQRVVTGNLQIDLFSKTDLAMRPILQDEAILPTEPDRKSPWLAAGLSLVVPGAGEFYAESYWKAAAFLAADVALIALAVAYDKKADTKDAENGRYADEHWSVVRYAEKTLDTFTEIDRTRYAGMINPNTNLPPWERVDWNLLNQLEREIGGGSGERRKSFSHTLPRRPEQQYFELIGKYGQYTLGWDDYVGPYNPSESANGGKFRFYADQRAITEDYFSKASTFVTITIINHVLSAADAAWTASMFNKRLHASMEMQTIPTRFGLTQVPVARVQYSF